MCVFEDLNFCCLSIIMYIYIVYLGFFFSQYKYKRILNVRLVHELVFNAKNKTRSKPQVNMLTFNLAVMELETKIFSNLE